MKKFYLNNLIALAMINIQSVWQASLFIILLSIRASITFSMCIIINSRVMFHSVEHLQENMHMKEEDNEFLTENTI